MRTSPAALALALVLLLAACGGDDSIGPQQESILGSYTLVTINGSDFPFLLSTPESSASSGAEGRSP